MEVILCKADWCGFCQKFLPKFQKMKSEGIDSVTFRIASDDETKKFGVTAYPTIFFRCGGGGYTEYVDKFEYDELLSAINSYKGELGEWKIGQKNKGQLK